MLVVTRKIGQQILICDGSIQMKVLKVNGGSISIGINAPKHIDIAPEFHNVKPDYSLKP